MNNLKSLSTVLILFMATGVSAQRLRRKGSSRQSTAKPATVQPLPQPIATPSAPRAPVLLATVNGQDVTTADIDPKVREEVEALDGKISAARKRILELQINTLLLENEARKRKLSPQQLYDTEVTKKIAEPTAAQIKKLIEDNRDQMDQADPVMLREQAVAFLRGQSEARISEAFVNRLRASNAIVIQSNQDTSALPPSTVVATVARRPITAGSLNERLKPIIFKLRLNTFLIQQPALDETINDLLLLAEANRRTVPPEEIVRREISEKIQQPAESEIAKFYEENKSRIPGELTAVRNQIASYLQTQDQQRLERALSERLRKGANIRVLVSEPQPPNQSISVDDDPFQGNANAAVTIVEFTDFQCPACAAMHPIIDEVVKSYGNKVRFVMRDFPLTMHTNARKAAEAANAAHAQGKFFEYAALLFKRQNDLDIPSLKKYASDIGLDRARFDVALDSGKYTAEVKHDIDDGQIYSVESTPTVFVNGVMLTTMSAEALRAAIDGALAASHAPPRVSAQ